MTTPLETALWIFLGFMALAIVMGFISAVVVEVRYRRWVKRKRQKVVEGHEIKDKQ